MQIWLDIATLKHVFPWHGSCNVSLSILKIKSFGLGLSAKPVIWDFTTTPYSVIHESGKDRRRQMTWQKDILRWKNIQLLELGLSYYAPSEENSQDGLFKQGHADALNLQAKMCSCHFQLNYFQITHELYGFVKTHLFLARVCGRHWQWGYVYMRPFCTKIQQLMQMWWKNDGHILLKSGHDPFQ